MRSPRFAEQGLMSRPRRDIGPVKAALTPRRPRRGWSRSQDRRLIAPSRFGYLGSPLPIGATPAQQDDMFAALLDELAVDRTNVVGISAGTTSALQFALRHPDRVKHLVVIAGNLPGNPTAVAPPAWARVFYADVSLWAMKVFAPRAYLDLMGVPKHLSETGEAAAFVDQMAESIFPMTPRGAGGVFDAFVSNPDVNDYPLEAITVPTLLVHAQDDPLTSYDTAERAAGRIPGAQLVTLPSGGHLLVGRTTSSGPRSARSWRNRPRHQVGQRREATMVTRSKPTPAWSRDDVTAEKPRGEAAGTGPVACGTRRVACW
jgi:pimeloyl-ACP methyl ester carboxylesterase